VDELIDLCVKHDAVPVIDDSHGIGVLGKTGRGIMEEKNVKDFRGIYTASLGKALANSGGIVCGKKEIIDYLKYYCSHLVYSTALPPPVLGGINRVIDIIKEEFEVISRKIWKYKNLITECLKDSGFDVVKGQAPITSIAAGTADNTILLAKRLFENNILSTPFVEPSVPVNEGKVRLIAGANLKETSIERALHTFKKIAKR
jgi:glycine C-acetyltransferase